MMFKTGDKFTAKNKLGEVHKYKFICIMPDSGQGGVVLHDMELPDDVKETIVEMAWFGERKIERVK